jgi:hypothetical protein
MKPIFSEPDDHDQPRNLVLATVPGLQQWPTVFGVSDWPIPPGEGFALLIALDATGMDETLVADCARWAITHGLFALSTWGENCEQVHDIFDDTDIGIGLEENDETEPAAHRPIVMTSWHADETLSAAIDFLWDFSVADDGMPVGAGGSYSW